MKLKRFWIIMLSFLMLIGAFELSREAVMAKPRKKTDNRWKKVYYNAIKKGTFSDQNGFELIDINFDGIPELVTVEFGGSKLFIVDNNKMIEAIYTSGYLSFHNNIVTDYNDRRLFEFESNYRMGKDKKLNHICGFYRDYREDINAKPIFYDGQGKDISEKKYESILSKYKKRRILEKIRIHLMVVLRS